MMSLETQLRVDKMGSICSGLCAPIAYVEVYAPRIPEEKVDGESYVLIARFPCPVDLHKVKILSGSEKLSFRLAEQGTPCLEQLPSRFQRGATLIRTKEIQWLDAQMTRTCAFCFTKLYNNDDKSQHMKYCGVFGQLLKAR